MSPHLSIVVTARNDDHGINLLRRIQTFANALIQQCRKHQLPAELIIVEWNPPPDRLPLADVLKWPAELDYCDVRIIEVPHELHRRYRHWQALPLYQMIAKNVGIRRARGEFILATNIDILLSEELMRFIAERRLERGKMYRLDRHDVMSDVPVDAPIEERLAYCESHLIRVNARDGSFRLDGAGHREERRVEENLRPLQPNDIAAPDSGLSFQRGWYERELEGDKPFRWGNNDAEIAIQPREPGVLVLELEPGPGLKLMPFYLEIRDEAKQKIARVRVKYRTLVKVPVTLSKNSFTRLHLHVEGGGVRIANDLRTMNFRALRCSVEENPTGSTAVVVNSSGGLDAWAARKLRWVREIILRRLFPPPPETLSEEPAAESGPAAVPLHTNACGDFTLLAREHWFDLRAYPELDLFSMNIDSLFCWAAHHGGAPEEILEDPMRIYHIDHSAGWTPEDKEKLYQKTMEKGLPWLNFGDCIAWARDMNRFQTTMIFNRDDWGMGAEQLPESSPVKPASARTAAQPD